MNKLLLTLASYMLAVCTYAQDEPRKKFFSLEAGGDVVLVEVLKYDNIRAEATWYGDAGKNVRGYGSRFYTGLKGQLRSRNNKFEFSGGLRYIRLLTAMTKGGDYYYSSNTSDFFYFMVEQTENSIEYFRVKEINESSDYLGIPLGVSYAPFGEHLFTVYFKLGIEVNYRLNTRTTVEFADPEMKQYNDQVVDQLRSVGDINAVFNTATGVRIKAGSKVTLSLEAGPSAFFTEDSSSLLNTMGSFGGQFNVQIGL